MLFCHFEKLNYRPFKITFAKSLIKKPPFLMIACHSSYRSLLFGKILQYGNFRQCNGGSSYFSHFTKKSIFFFFLLIIISVAFHGDRDVKMDHSISRAILKKRIFMSNIAGNVL